MKLGDLDAARWAMTPGTWQPGVLVSEWITGAGPAREPSRVEMNSDQPGAISTSDPLARVISGCGCCSSPDAKPADIDGICALVNAAPALIRIARAALAYRDAGGAREISNAYEALIEALDGVEP